MRCATARRRLTEVVLGEASPRQRAMVSRHLEGCGACREELRRTERLIRALAVLPHGPLPAGLEGKTLGRIRVLAADTAHAGAWRQLRRWAGFGLPALAAAAVLFVTVRSEDAADLVPGERVAAKAVPTIAGEIDEPMRHAAPSVGRKSAQVARSTPKTTPAPMPREDPPVDVRPELPDELLARPDLFVDLPMLTQMEKLENYDAIVGVDLPDRGRPNG